MGLINSCVYTKKLSELLAGIYRYLVTTSRISFLLDLYPLPIGSKVKIQKDIILAHFVL